MSVAPLTDRRGRRDAGSIVQPARAAFWLYPIVLALGAASVVPNFVRLSSAAPSGALGLSALIHTLWLIPALAVITHLDLFEREPLSFCVAAVLWGGVVATGFALVANDNVLSYLSKLDPKFATDWGASISAPVIEETLKLLGVVVLILINRRVFESVLDGFVFGALVGLGFQVVENVMYALNAAIQAGETWTAGVVVSFFVRAVVNGLWSHAAFTAMTGAGVAYVVVGVRRPIAVRLAAAGALYTVAWALHFVNNSPILEIVLERTDWYLTIVQIVLNGLVVLAIARFVYRLAARQEYRWFARAVGDEPDLLPLRELAALASNKTRKEAVEAARREHGRKAARAQSRLQRAQLGYGVALARSADPDTDPGVARWHRRIDRARAQVVAADAEPPESPEAPTPHEKVRRELPDVP
ncbi:PrsW family intramembrane metalloprotease [Embleya scabrispora]|uniref:PrsW family intramembrane metalloprotease n=1 Tax=Embleya scabrispora TaxID=159449 RepID=UPI000368DDDB|nr:PrsW family intramembrane metalloprotease [Embleya scabrispora]MYS79074.1 PrsW family intramembrane metalloprotease [Streptomyces sp. SID5474]